MTLFPGQQPPDWQPPRPAPRGRGRSLWPVWGGLGLLGAAVVVAAFVEGPKGGEVPVAAVGPVKVGAAELVAAYAENAIAARQKFGGAIEVTGTVYMIDTDFSGDPMISFDSGAVVAGLGKGEMAAAAALKSGQAITVRCEKSSMPLSSVTLTGCAIVMPEAAPDPMVWPSPNS